jgi:hypothetical protein
MATRINQQSPFAPAVCLHRGRIHMVFAANNDTGELLHAVSDDGIAWTRLHDVRQSTSKAPAIVSLNNVLRVLFVAKNATNELLSCTYEDNADVFTDNVRVKESSSEAPTLLNKATNLAFLYFKANNPTNDILAVRMD